MAAVSLAARLRRKPPSSAPTNRVARSRARSSGIPAAANRWVAALSQPSKISAVTSRSGSSELATSRATVAMGQAST